MNYDVAETQCELKRSKKCAIVQSNYIPWKGYFDLINMVDEFILYDTAQFTKNDWRNRNRIKTPRGAEWLTIPVEHRFGQTISETRISDRHWNIKHWKTINQNYSKAKFFSQYKENFEELYLSAVDDSLSLVNHLFLTKILPMLGIGTKITWSHEYELVEGQTRRLVSLCKQASANEYLSGPAAKNYIDEKQFAAAGIKLSFIDYYGYPTYDQIYPPFDHAVSIIDLIFNTGANAPKYMKSFMKNELVRN